MAGTGLLPYIRHVDEGRGPSGLDEIGAYRPYRRIGIVQLPSGWSGSRYAGLTCYVILGHKVFAIVGRSPQNGYQENLLLKSKKTVVGKLVGGLCGNLWSTRRVVHQVVHRAVHQLIHNTFFRRSITYCIRRDHAANARRALP